MLGTNVVLFVPKWYVLGILRLVRARSVEMIFNLIFYVTRLMFSSKMVNKKWVWMLQCKLWLLNVVARVTNQCGSSDVADVCF